MITKLRHWWTAQSREDRRYDALKLAVDLHAAGKATYPSKNDIIDTADKFLEFLEDDS